MGLGRNVALGSTVGSQFQASEMDKSWQSYGL